MAEHFQTFHPKFENQLMPAAYAKLCTTFMDKTMSNLRLVENFVQKLSKTFAPNISKPLIFMQLVTTAY